MKNISKIVVSYVLTLLVLISGFTFTSKAQAVVGPTLTLGSITTTAGSHIIVPVIASNFNNSVSAMDLLVSYDPTKLAINSVIENPNLADPLFNEHYSSNLIYISYLAAVDENFDLNNGVIATLDFTVLADSSTTTNLAFKTTAPGLKSSLYDIYGTKIPANYVGGVVNITENTVLTVSKSSSSPSAGNVQISETNSTLDVLMNKFKIKDQGLDAKIKKISLSLTGVGATPAEIASSVKIRVDGGVYAVNDTNLGVNGIYEFTLDNIVIPSGVTSEFVVYADIKHLGGNFNQGDSFKIDYAGVVAEDINGDNITNIIGSANGEFQTFYPEIYDTFKIKAKGVVNKKISNTAVKVISSDVKKEDATSVKGIVIVSDVKAIDTVISVDLTPSENVNKVVEVVENKEVNIINSKQEPVSQVSLEESL